MPGRERDQPGPGRDQPGPERGPLAAAAWGQAGSPVGLLTVGCTAAGVARIGFGPRGPASSGPPPGSAVGHPGAAGAAAGAAARAMLEQALRELAEYFAGRRRAFAIEVDWSAATPAQQPVLAALHASVGFGQTITYGALARLAGLDPRPGALPARVVGQFMGANPCPIVVPCHRVVASDGLGGYSGGTGIEAKRWLLTFEGALPPTLDWDSAGLSPGRPGQAPPGPP